MVARGAAARCQGEKERQMIILYNIDRIIDISEYYFNLQKRLLLITHDIIIVTGCIICSWDNLKVIYDLCYLKGF